MFYFSLWFLTSSLWNLCFSSVGLSLSSEYTSKVLFLPWHWHIWFHLLFYLIEHLCFLSTIQSTRVTVVNKILCLRLKLLIWRGVSWWLRVLELDGCGFKYFLCQLIALWRCTCYLTSLHLSFFISKKEILNISTLQHFYIKFLY